MCRQITIFRTPEVETTIKDLCIAVRGIAKLFVIVFSLSIIQIGLSPPITRTELAWRLTAILLYLANIIILQVVGLNPTSIGCNFALFTVFSLLLFDIADITIQIRESKEPYWSFVSLIAALIQVLNLYVLYMLRKKLTISNQHDDYELNTPRPGIELSLEHERTIE
jgi:hypothetical protein